MRCSQVRLDTAKATMPETGYLFRKQALFMKEVKGISLQYIVEGIRDGELVYDYFLNKINSTQVSVHM